MTDAMHSIVSAELGRACDAFFYTERSAAPFMRAPFNQFSEERGGGAFTFMTGAGGFQQEFLYGYTGMRKQLDGVAFAPILPPQTSELKITGVKYQGRTFDVTVAAKTTSIEVTEGSPFTVFSGGREYQAQSGTVLEIPTRQSSDCGPDRGNGKLIGSLSSPAGGDDGFGGVEYPANSTFNPGALDMTDFQVFSDGDKVRFVTTVSGDIHNEWGLEGMSVQLLHAYLRLPNEQSTGVTPALDGTNVNTEVPWQYVLIANPRVQGAAGGTGLFDSQGNLISKAHLVVKRRSQIVLSLDASVFRGIDLSKVEFAVAMMGAGQSDEGPNYIRPVYDCNTPGQPGWVRDWRFCGGLGTTTGTSPYDTDTSDPNVIKIFTPQGRTQHEILSFQNGRPALPFVALTTPVGPVVVDPVKPERVGNTVTIPEVAGVVYRDESGNVLTGDVSVPSNNLVVLAKAVEGYKLNPQLRASWLFAYDLNARPMVDPVKPERVGNTVTIPEITGVVFKDGLGNVLSGQVLVPKANLTVFAIPDAGYRLNPQLRASWLFAYDMAARTMVDPLKPVRDGRVVTIPVVTGVVYRDGAGNVLAGDVAVPSNNLVVLASPADGYRLNPELRASWLFPY